MLEIGERKPVCARCRAVDSAGLRIGALCRRGSSWAARAGDARWEGFGDPPRHRILTFSDTLFQGILAMDAADRAFLDYNSGGREGLQIGGVSCARFIRHY